jgi:hypothetical protein
MSALLSVVLLPEQRRFAGAPLSENTARLMARANALHKLEAGYQAQLQRYFQSPTSLPMAAVLAAASDDAFYVCVEPAFVRAELGVMRLMAFGDDFQLSSAERLAFAQELQPIFADSDWQWMIDSNDGWNLRNDSANSAPNFAWPEDLLGADVLHTYQLAEQKYWNAWSNEAQIVLHNSALNQQRVVRGQLPVNAVLFWGGGRRTSRIESPVASVQSSDHILQMLYHAAERSNLSVDTLIDVRHARDFDAVFQQSIAPALAQGKRVRLDFSDGSQFELHSSQRFKFWRRRWTFDA